MRAGIVAGCVGLAMLVSGCDPNDRAYFRSGIGTQLYTVDAATATEYQNIYLDYLCRQSLPYVGADAPGCSQEIVPANVWPVIVQAGMNDIDARCDSYLAWLDQKKRTNAGILAEIGAVRIAVDALTNPNIAGVSGVGLAAVSAAFGLATNTVNNFNSLLLQVDHTTVQMVVFINRRDFREKVLDLPINNKPMAVHALRTYLTICMPMTISANINASVTVFQQGGAGALGKHPLDGTTTIASPARARDNAGTRSDRSGITEHPEFAPFFVSYSASAFPISRIKALQGILCVPESEVGLPGETFAAHIAIFEDTSPAFPADRGKIRIDGKIDSSEAAILAREKACDRNVAKNYYERRLVANNAVPTVIMALNKLKFKDSQNKDVPDLPPGTTLDGARERIGLARESLAVNPKTSARINRNRPASMSQQWTRDLFEALGNL